MYSTNKTFKKTKLPARTDLNKYGPQIIFLVDLVCRLENFPTPYLDVDL